ncbi:MAG: GntR family transcriptional regulator [Paracoccaceae bacterium]
MRWDSEDHLRDAILFGQIAPGQPMTIQGLTDPIGAGISLIREVLQRLTTDDAVQMLGSRRMVVPILA